MPSWVSRRQFIHGAAAAAAGWPLLAAQRTANPTNTPFVHGVASGDPLSDAVMLWTRVTPPGNSSSNARIDVRWRIATDERMTAIVSSGTALAVPERDFTVKVDARNLRPGRTYYYAFDARGERSPVGRTKTLPADRADRLRLASVSCANYPAGYFNVYRCVANRDDLDAVLHLGDYIYEFANGVYGDGSKTDRVPMPADEAITLADYRRRYATYRTDTDLQAAHRKHPFIVVWDDHESANNSWAGGAEAHTAAKGDWAMRQAAAYRAYLEWMPIRESTDSSIHIYRSFRFGNLVDLVMLDTRGLRDQQIFSADPTALAAVNRSLLGSAQESWLFEQMRSSQRAGTRWRLLGQQVIFTAITLPGVKVQGVDAWEGYPAARQRVIDFLVNEQISDVAILTGDIHSSWAADVPHHTFNGYEPATGKGSIAVELIAPAISSPPLFSIEGVRERAPLLRLVLPHVKYLEGENRGYVLIDVNRERLIADWYHVPGVTERSPVESRSARFVCERGSSRLVAG
jgi:alkaline phosphatase D